MDTTQADSGRSNRSNVGKVGGVSKSPTKYIFKPEVVNSTSSKHAINGANRDPNSEKPQPRSRDTQKGLLGFLARSTKRAPIKSSEVHVDRKRSHSLFTLKNVKEKDRRLSELEENRLLAKLVAEHENKGSRTKGRNPEERHSRSDDRKIRTQKNSECHSTVERSPDSEIRSQGEKSLDGKNYETSSKYSEERKRRLAEIIRRNEKHELAFAFQLDLENDLDKENRLSANKDECSSYEPYSSHQEKRSPQSETNSSEGSSHHKNDRVPPRADSPYPSTNHVELFLATRENINRKYSSKSLQEDLTRCITNCENCGESHCSSSTKSNFRPEYPETGIVGLPDELNFTKKFPFDRQQEIPVTSLLYRSKSSPQLSGHDSGVGSNEQPAGRPTARLVADLRQLLTLKQHYYPEGGWGWVIIVVGILVQILTHGLHGASGVLLQQVANKFGPRIYLES
ncbi:biorientation of chromosomes in cell division protein 1-like 1, partial [Orussus abietinus]|uniref:biorientation of chromosomes in cell division protein 1-like 1 n=1 Tax=Orussus abietinus TaxID=222816 RepID=UPI000C715C3A